MLSIGYITFFIKIITYKFAIIIIMLYGDKFPTRWLCYHKLVTYKLL